MDDEFKDLQRLLRLKRYEMPPPDYFEDFLLDFHRRQRAELLKRPLWRLVMDRFEGALPSFSPARYAYAGACATAVAATVLASTHILATAPAGTSPLVVAAVRRPAMHAPDHGFIVKVSPRINILSSRPSLRLSPELDFNRPSQAAVSYASSRPRPVLDTQPVSYEPPFSF